MSAQREISGIPAQTRSDNWKSIKGASHMEYTQEHRPALAESVPQLRTMLWLRGIWDGGTEYLPNCFQWLGVETFLLGAAPKEKRW